MARARRERDRAGRRQRALSSESAPRSPRHLVVCCRSTPALAADRRRSDRPLARERSDVSRALRRAPRRCMRRLPTRPAERRSREVRAARLPAAGSRPLSGEHRRKRTRLLWAASASAGTRSSQATAARPMWPLDAVSPLLRHRRAPSRACTAAASATLARAVAIAPGERTRRWPAPSGVWRALAAAGDDARRPPGRARRRRRRRPRRLLRGHLPARRARSCRCPTTLVAQVDSAYGGKTGVDLPEAKNYVGAYHQPAGVLVDPDRCATLPAAELAAG